VYHLIDKNNHNKKRGLNDIVAPINQLPVVYRTLVFKQNTPQRLSKLDLPPRIEYLVPLL
jgi:hypothetical protein